MIEDQRHELLRSLGQRHDDLIRQLDELNQRIEQTLVALGATPPGTVSGLSPLSVRSG